MRVAVSNIAWERAEEPDVLALLEHRGVHGLEVAPTQVWDEPTAVPPAELQAARRRWNDRGLQVVALQALLFGKPSYVIFGEPGAREACFEHLAQMIRLGGLLGAGALVFGSPRNRAIGGLPLAAALEIAVPFFRRLGVVAQQEGTRLCIEPNPPAYGCDFIHTIDEAAELVEAVDHPGFRLQLDVSAMTLNGEDYDAALGRGVPLAAHCHASEPHLAPTGSGATDHARVAGRLRELAYAGWVSIEMRKGAAPPNLPAVASAVEFTLKTYGD
ncbi:MAG TPA: TIM barrel protein [Candidatus Polarisedimenticolaceae bacterium]|nr:TIM barrel protein [Candidatus Polarisedimenticolaceae bacterium]